ncbi:hypothetical protein BDV96DRAFT_573618 [Lophiotrema nucula]|uniref:Uncharacterized protein n=1 Tax=Lophiotrema nucula TaxID=690887 RepID=A0A6A5ZAY8_9PLEO|nr:hypothetical protein BDV96DRAFT_573618 [Lophiotrema nucula]
MATSPTAVSHPMPLRAVESPSVDLHHPTPDLQSLQGAYVGNIDRLEEHAERMSSSGSDIGEEIRRLQLEHKLSDSRRSSLRSGFVDERQVGTRSRNASTSSYTHSIVDLNGTARWGGYSPGGYVTSPVGSLRSGSFSQPPRERQRSGSRASRLGQVVHAEEHDANQHTIAEQPGSPQSHHPVPQSLPRDDSPPSRRSVSSFTRQYDMIAQEIQDEFHNDLGPSRHSGMQQGPYGGQRYSAHHDLPDRPSTAASTDTTHQARTLWQDFDGVHCPDTVPEEELAPSHASGSRDSSMIKAAPELPLEGAPPPDDGMVFYPAPVPKMLNLPKRLSKIPAANVQARRRTQLLESMQTENRKSAPWLSSDTGLESSQQNTKSMDPRKSRMSLANLPPQLRASAYFDQVGPAQEYEVKGESAEDTLDSILEASAHAPVSAFTDHPFAGHLGNEIYGKEHTRTQSQIFDLEQINARKSRSSLNLLDTHRKSSGDPLNKLKKRNSSADLNLLTVKASSSRMSLGDELDEPDHEARGPETHDDLTPTRRSFDGEHDLDPNLDEEEDDLGEEEQPEDAHFFGPPTTLLAELQMRKQQQKTRNLTAATAFPNGMHSTLLELDAVAEIEKKKRQRQKVNLAWEAALPPNAEDGDSDDDVPLGVLFPGRDGLMNKRPGASAQQQSDWDRPLGLIARRELEDREPLSRRRNRLLGVNGRQPLSASQSQQHLAVPTSTTPQPESSEGEEEGETLAQRIRRLKARQALDNAIGTDVRKSTVSGDFAAEMMSQFGVPEEAGKPKLSPSLGAEEEETLGQRRERLRLEAIASGDANPMGSRPPLRASLSMADILSAHPIDNTNQARKVSEEALLSSLPQGSLLHKNEVKQSRRKAERLDVNRRVSSFANFDKPLLGDLERQAPEQAVAANIQAYKQKMAGTPMTAPTQSTPSLAMPGMMGGMMGNMSSMNLTGQPDSYFPQANMGIATPFGMNHMATMSPMGYPMGGMMPQQMMSMNMGMNMGMPMTGMPSMPSMPNLTYPYPQMANMGGMRQSSMINLPAQMNMTQMQQQMEQPLDPRQRDQIDRWRQSVVH